MINLPVKIVTIRNFKLHELSVWDYNHNSEFEQCYKNQFEKGFRVVEFELPTDAEVLSCRYFQLRGSDIFSFQEFTKYDKEKCLIRFICQSDNWGKIEEFKFCYFYLSEDLVEIRNKMKQMEDQFNKKVSELNAHIFEVNGTILSHE